MHKDNYFNKMGTEVLDFTFIKRWDRGRMRKVAMSYAFLLVLTVFFLSSVSSWAVIYISNIEELQKIGNDSAYPLDGEYELTQDIDASDTVNWNDGAGFAPIGTDWLPFTGKFDGKGHKITGLYINYLDTDYIGLFGYIDSGSEVKNVGLENAMVSGGSYVGGLVGKNFLGTVSGCYSTGSVFGDWYVGGLVGENWYGTVSGCYSTGSVSGRYDVGGLVGGNGGTVSGCYSTGSVSGEYEVGGLVGSNEGMVNNSFAMGSVTGYIHDIGGLIGYLWSGSVTNTYSTGLVGGSGSNKGGLIGYIEASNNPTVTSSYWDTQTSGMNTSAGGEGKTTAEMKQQATFIDWDFTDIWDIIEDSTYPWLKSLGQPQVPPPPVEKNISSLEELNKIGRDIEYPWDGIYHLVNDIDASETVNWEGGKGFKPIRVFTGKFYGQGHKIVNLYINRPDEGNVGLFDVLYGEVRDLGIENAMVSGGSM